jgi:hypothetical protein
VSWVPPGWLAAGLALAVVGSSPSRALPGWPVVVLGWVLIGAGIGIGAWAWNRRDRGEDDEEGWI